MASYREVEILQAESIATAGTRTIDINVMDPISKIDVIWKKTNTNRTPIAHPGKIIKNVSVLDGADVLYSMNGQDGQALAYYQNGKVPGAMTNYELGQWSMQHLQILFGRHMWDEIYALDPRRFNNLQIKIEHDLDLGGSTGTVADLSVYAHVFDEKSIEPRGFILSKEIYSFLPVANAWVYIDLPLDYPIRALMFGANECEDGPEYNLANIKLHEGNGKHILVQSATERYMFQSAARDPLWQEHIIAKPAAADTALTFYCAPHWERTFLGMVTEAGGDSFYTSAAGCAYAFASENGNIFEGFAIGHIPFGQVYIPLGNEKDEWDYWEPGRSGAGRLELQAGATPDTDEYVRVHCQQIRTY